MVVRNPPALQQEFPGQIVEYAADCCCSVDQPSTDPRSKTSKSVAPGMYMGCAACAIHDFFVFLCWLCFTFFSLSLSLSFSLLLPIFFVLVVFLLASTTNRRPCLAGTESKAQYRGNTKLYTHTPQEDSTPPLQENSIRAIVCCTAVLYCTVVCTQEVVILVSYHLSCESIPAFFNACLHNHDHISVHSPGTR